MTLRVASFLRVSRLIFHPLSGVWLLVLLSSTVSSPGVQDEDALSGTLRGRPPPIACGVLWDLQPITPVGGL